jgi:hypothetical protein
MNNDQNSIKTELENRIKEHLSRDNSDVVVCLWCGYLAGLMEWQVISFNDYQDLSFLLPQTGSKEICELFSGEPLSEEFKKEVEEYTKVDIRQPRTWDNVFKTYPAGTPISEADFFKKSSDKNS